LQCAMLLFALSRSQRGKFTGSGYSLARLLILQSPCVSRSLGGWAIRAPSSGRSRMKAVAPRKKLENRFMWKRLIKSPPPAKQSMAPFTPRTSPWHAVSIVSSAPCCSAAMGLLGTRFLSKEAPVLPLRHCSMGAECRCSYQHHHDRRGSPRRTPDLWSPGRVVYGGEERRRKPSRRSTDLK
jgi:hypothetical protein